MLILTLRTDKPDAEVGIYEDTQQLLYKTWQAHRQLAETLHLTIQENLKSHAKSWSDLKGIIIYKGPGSFTGLRIGATIANTLAQSLNVPIVGTDHEDWIDVGIKKLHDGSNNTIVTPEYGAPVHITPQKK